MSAVSTRHPFICEGCFDDVPLTELEYIAAMDHLGRLLCERCRSAKLNGGAKRWAETPSRSTRKRRGGRS